MTISEKNWKIYPNDQFGGLIKYAQLDEGQDIESLQPKDFKQRSIDGSSENLYSYYLHNLPENNTQGKVTTKKALVIEFNGEFKDNVDLSEDLIFKIEDPNE